MTDEKNPKIAALLNLIFWGLGHIYIGKKVGLGVGLLFAEFVFYAAYLLLYFDQLFSLSFPLHRIVLEVFWIIMTLLIIYDSYREAIEVNRLGI
ncbi:MAG: hypothetical protein J7K72_03645 [Candidatus Aenigmarchaeota archaeon]|nr:hypothetical protein [Candidatus Aenigmarchaeota archaeon]